MLVNERNDILVVLFVFHSTPCTPENAASGEFYFPHGDATKFIQCSEWGQCYVMPCAPGTEWNTAVNNCT